MFARTGAEFLRARITGAGEGVVHTSDRARSGADRDRGRRLADVGPEGAGGARARAAAQELRRRGAPAVPRRGPPLLGRPGNGGRAASAGSSRPATTCAPGWRTTTATRRCRRTSTDFLGRHELGDAGHTARRLLHLAHDRPGARRDVRGRRRRRAVPAGVGRGDPAGPRVRPARRAPRRARPARGADPRPGAVALPGLRPLAQARLRLPRPPPDGPELSCPTRSSPPSPAPSPAGG